VSARLIVTADDVGMHPGMTAGAIRAHHDGIVTSCSLVANGEAFDDAVQRLRGCPMLAVGVHLALVDGKPLSKGRSLGRHRLPSGYVQFLPRYLGRLITTVDIEGELRAQIERVLATGLPVSHLNGHQHLHLLPRIFEVVLRLAQEYRIRYVRIVDDRGGKAGELRKASIRLLSRLGRRAGANASARSVRTNNRTIGVAEAGGLTAPRLVELIRSVAGLTELVCHPGTDDVALANAHHWGYAWMRETQALCAASVRETIRAADVELIAPSDL
jgi:predicted glycoside hydrolase/deacetylase ChbG (UPF0249 family)